MKYLIGMDGGGTHCRLMACEPSGRILGRAVGGSSNLESNPAQNVAQVLKTLTENFLRTSGLSPWQCAAVCLGSAGVDTGESLAKMEKILGEVWPYSPSMVVNDGEIALAAQTQGGPGVLVISGTGSIAVAMDEQGRGCRAGGYGYLVGDEGSGYWVSREAVSAVFHAQDGLGPQTRLRELVLQGLGLASAEQLMDFVYARNKSDLAKAAPWVARAMEEGDAAAKEIMERAAEYLAALAAALAQRAGIAQGEYPLVLGGGFLMNTPWLREQVAHRVKQACPLFRPQLLSREAEWGAVYLAARLAGIAVKN